MDKRMEERDMTRISVVLAVFCAISYINYMIGQIFNIGGMVVSLTVLGAVMVLFYKTMLKVKLASLAFVLITLITLYYITTRQISYTTLFGKEFLFYFCLSSVLAMYKCNVEKFFRYTTYAVLLILPLYGNIFENEEVKYITMGLSYSLMPVLLAPMFHFMFYRKKAGFLMKILYIISFIMIVNLLLKGTRGFLMTVVVSVGFCFIHGVKKKRPNLPVIRLAIIALLSVFAVVYFQEIMAFLEMLFDKWDIDAYFIEKIRNLEGKGDITNGRSAIFEYTFENIMKKPFFGHGLSTLFYNSNYRYVYPHNMFLQLLYDGGVVLSVPILLVLGYALIRTFKMVDTDEAAYMLFLISICLPQMMVSGDIWKNEFFWLLIMHTVKYHTGKSKKNKENIQNFVPGEVEAVNAALSMQEHQVQNN